MVAQAVLPIGGERLAGGQALPVARRRATRERLDTEFPDSWGGP